MWFTLLVFLGPTVTMYYLFFAILNLLLLVVQGDAPDLLPVDGHVRVAIATAQCAPRRPQGCIRREGT